MVMSEGIGEEGIALFLGELAVTLYVVMYEVNMSPLGLFAMKLMIILHA